MSANCDVCGSAPAVLRMNGLVMCDNCSYDPALEERIDELARDKKREQNVAEKGVRYGLVGRLG